MAPKTNKRFMEVTLTCRCAMDVEETVTEGRPTLSVGDLLECPKHGEQQVKDIETLCGCGELLHYADPVNEAYMRQLSVDQGEYIPIKVPGHGKWLVQRHFIALHGIKAAELEGSQWEKVE